MGKRRGEERRESIFDLSPAKPTGVLLSVSVRFWLLAEKTKTIACKVLEKRGAGKRKADTLHVALDSDFKEREVEGERLGEERLALPRLSTVMTLGMLYDGWIYVYLWTLLLAVLLQLG